MAVIQKLGSKWAEDGPTRAPTSQEIAAGFPKGPAERELFNYLMQKALEDEVGEEGEVVAPPLLFFGCL